MEMRLEKYEKANAWQVKHTTASSTQLCSRLCLCQSVVKTAAGVSWLKYNQTTLLHSEPFNGFPSPHKSQSPSRSPHSPSALSPPSLLPPLPASTPCSFSDKPGCSPDISAPVSPPPSLHSVVTFQQGLPNGLIEKCKTLPAPPCSVLLQSALTIWHTLSCSLPIYSVYGLPLCTWTEVSWGKGFWLFCSLLCAQAPEQSLLNEHTT